MIKIDDKFRINCGDGLNATLQELKESTSGKKIGEKYWDNIGYYRDIPNAFKAYCKLETFKAESLNDLMKIINNLNEKVTELFEVKI